MKTLKHHWLALFLAFCLPAQALAAVLLECEQHVQAAEVTPDCHGSETADSPDTATTDVAAKIDSTHTSEHKPLKNTAADTNACFHCSGACQNLKPLSLIAKAQQALSLDNKALASLTPATHAGVRSNPSRPPCQTVLS